MAKPKRNKNVKACPNADRWMREHSDAADNLKRIIKHMDDRYEGGNQGYINRATNFVEYRYDPLEGEHHFRHVQLFARQKHVVVRFTVFAKRRGKGPGISKTLKDAQGNDYFALEFPVAADTSLDELDAYLRTTATFSRDRTMPTSRGPAGRRSHEARTSPGKRATRDAIDRAEQAAASELAEPIASEDDARERELRAVFLRRGQGKFRKALLNAYEKRCAVTGCTMEDVLEAAHIIPYNGDDTNRCDNGLLLRADIHTLFDLGLLWVNREMKVEIANALQRTEYGELHGKGLRLPTDPALRPHPEHLERHAQITVKLRAARR
ncbi:MULTISPECIES: HNH endonuclease [unclassified Burkholderia]|uniref:HNH endonuclease n=1 Tax=unclassified Burkholderia TaxID=2613784 RepID=UPI001E536657|nr:MULTISPECIES: HNH endonuclease [unclassified Burkholderia]UEP32141.1 HNH endonuclease [Burkholderia sp. B21-007]UEP45272.1 HNH endonuclease [Burkholderia sp. B21-005]